MLAIDEKPSTYFSHSDFHIQHARGTVSAVTCVVTETRVSRRFLILRKLVSRFLSRDGPPNGFQELIAFNGDCGDEDVGLYNGDALPKCGASVTDVSWRQCFAWRVQYRLYATGTENNWIELGWA